MIAMAEPMSLTQRLQRPSPGSWFKSATTNRRRSWIWLRAPWFWRQIPWKRRSKLTMSCSNKYLILVGDRSFGCSPWTWKFGTPEPQDRIRSVQKWVRRIVWRRDCVDTAKPIAMSGKRVMSIILVFDSMCMWMCMYVYIYIYGFFHGAKWHQCPKKFINFWWMLQSAQTYLISVCLKGTSWKTWVKCRLSSQKGSQIENQTTRDSNSPVSGPQIRERFIASMAPSIYGRGQSFFAEKIIRSPMVPQQITKMHLSSVQFFTDSLGLRYSPTESAKFNLTGMWHVKTAIALSGLARKQRNRLFALKSPTKIEASWAVSPRRQLANIASAEISTLWL